MSQSLKIGIAATQNLTMAQNQEITSGAAYVDEQPLIEPGGGIEPCGKPVRGGDDKDIFCFYTAGRQKTDKPCKYQDVFNRHMIAKRI